MDSLVFYLIKIFISLIGAIGFLFFLYLCSKQKKENKRSETVENEIPTSSRQMSGSTNPPIENGDTTNPVETLSLTNSDEQSDSNNESEISEEISPSISFQDLQENIHELISSVFTDYTDDSSLSPEDNLFRKIHVDVSSLLEIENFEKKEVYDIKRDKDRIKEFFKEFFEIQKTINILRNLDNFENISPGEEILNFGSFLNIKNDFLNLEVHNFENFIDFLFQIADITFKENVILECQSVYKKNFINLNFLINLNIKEKYEFCENYLANNLKPIFEHRNTPNSVKIFFEEILKRFNDSVKSNFQYVNYLISNIQRLIEIIEYTNAYTSTKLSFDKVLHFYMNIDEDSKYKKTIADLITFAKEKFDKNHEILVSINNSTNG